MIDFAPKPSLVDGPAPVDCRAIVVIPARNEAESLRSTCDSFLGQVNDRGEPLPAGTFEVILLLNNCTDGSAEVARQWCVEHPGLTIHVCERSFEPADAHVGSARSLLMDSAWWRLQSGLDQSGSRPVCGILTTDADTVIAPDWVFRNLEALQAGADVVGGAIHMDHGQLPAEVREAYLRDREYQRLVAKLEDRLDPQPGDPCPRHLEHFGGSLACTPEMYARAGGMPAITPLEDVAFIDRARRVDAKIRHEPQVKVYTSARLHGRVDIGLSGQLRVWQQMQAQQAEHRVTSAAYLRHRFAALRALRTFYQGGDEQEISRFACAAAAIAEARRLSSTCGHFLAQIDCNRLIDESFTGQRVCAISEAIGELSAAL